MAIQINPNLIAVSPGLSEGASRRRPEQQAAPALAPRPRQPQAAALNIIPSDESLQTRIRGALASQREGVTLERGRIVNLLV